MRELTPLEKAGVAAGALAGAAGVGAVVLWVAGVFRPKAPKGKGIFVRSLIGDTPTPASMVERVRDLGLQWVALIGESKSGQVSTHYPERLPAYVSALKSAGIKVWLWGWPFPEDVDGFASEMGQLARDLDVSGVIVNAEKPFYHHRHAAAARRLMTQLKKQSGGRPVGLTSYGGGPPHHPRFPWAAFAETSDFGMPQIYDTKHRLPREYPTQSMESWKRAGFGPLVPIWGASNRHTPEQMADIAARTPITNGGTSWWTFDHAIKSRGRSAVVRGYLLPDREEQLAA